MARLTVASMTAKVEEKGYTLTVVNCKGVDKYQVVDGYNYVTSANTLDKLQVVLADVEPKVEDTEDDEDYVIDGYGGYGLHLFENGAVEIFDGEDDFVTRTDNKDAAIAYIDEIAELYEDDSEYDFETEEYKGYRLDVYASGSTDVLTMDGTILEGFDLKIDALNYVDGLSLDTDDMEVQHVRGAGVAHEFDIYQYKGYQLWLLSYGVSIYNFGGVGYISHCDEMATAKLIVDELLGDKKPLVSARDVITAIRKGSEKAIGLLNQFIDRYLFIAKDWLLGQCDSFKEMVKVKKYIDKHAV